MHPPFTHVTVKLNVIASLTMLVHITVMQKGTNDNGGAANNEKASNQFQKITQNNHVYAEESIYWLLASIRKGKCWGPVNYMHNRSPI